MNRLLSKYRRHQRKLVPLGFLLFVSGFLTMQFLIFGIGLVIMYMGV